MICTISEVRELMLAPNHGLYVQDGELVESLTHPPGASCLLVNETDDAQTVDDLCQDSETWAALETVASQVKFYAAAVGDDGLRPVVWGLGEGDTIEAAEEAARADAAQELADSDCVSEIETVQIDAARHQAILEGDVSAEDLVASEGAL